MADGILGYNMPLRFSADHLLRDIPMDMVAVPDAFISKRELERPGDGRWLQRGAVYDGDGVLLPEFEMMSDLYPGRFDNSLAIDASRLAQAERIKRPCVYLGALNGHFGHFLVESLARSWALAKLDRKIGAVFHHASFVGVNDMAAAIGSFPSFMTVSFDLLGLDASRLVFANRDLRFDNLFVPTAQFWINCFGSRNLCEVYDDIREEIVRRSGPLVGPSKRLYLTRTQLEETLPHKIRKSIANEAAVEALFVDQGFESVALEHLPFAEQVQMLANASHIAGPTGSALHMAVFTARPDAELIGVDWRNSRTQYILDAARELRAHHIYCFKGRDHRGAPLVDVEAVSAALSDVMSPAGALGGRTQVYATALEAMIAARDRERLHLTPPPEVDAVPAFMMDSAPLSPQIDHQPCQEIFRTFLSMRPERSRLANQSAVIWILLDAVQTLMGVEGDILDAGVGVGAATLLGLLLLRDDERTVGLDSRRHPIFEHCLERLSPEPRARLAFLEMTMSDPRVDALPSASVRLAHVAASDAHQLRVGIDRISRLIRPDGVLILDDFFQMSSPDVTTTVYDLLREDGGWRVLMIGFSTVYLARSSNKPAYADIIAREAEAYFSKFGDFILDQRVRMAGDFVCSVKGNTDPALALLSPS